jgi:homoaconitate hydratase
LKYAGIKVVLAGSFSETFKRNAINNGLLVLEAPEVVKMLRDKFGSKPKVLTRRTGILADVSLTTGDMRLSTNQDFKVPSVGLAAQEIMVAGGLEEWIKLQLA